MPNNLHIKSSRTRVLNSFPTSSMGNEGDIIIAKIQGRGVYLCTKAANTWYVANRLQEARNVENSSIRNLKTNQITIDRLTESTKDTDKFIVSDEGVLKYRTSGEIVDDLDIPIVDIYYKNAYCSLGQYNNEEDCIANGGEWYYSDNDSYDNISSSAENELLTIGRSIGNLDAEPTLLYDGSTLEIKYNSNYDDNWQTSAQTNLFKLSYDSSNNAIFDVDSSGDLTLDVSGDIELNADGGDIAFKDASADLAALSSSGLTISNISEVGSDTDKILMSDSGVIKYVTGANLRSYIGAGTSSVTALDDLSDVTYSSGDLTISSLDTIISGALTIDSSGSITIDSVNSSGAITDGTLFKTDGTTFGSITTHHALSCFTLFEAAGSSTDDYFEIQVDAAGATTLNTVDAAATAAHLTLNADGNVILDPASGAISFYNNGSIQATLDAAGANTNFTIFEDGGATTDDWFQIAVGANGSTILQTKDSAGANGHIELAADGNIILDSATGIALECGTGQATCDSHFALSATSKLRFDGDSGHTLIYEATDDNLLFNVGNVDLMVLVEDATTSATLSSKIYHLAPTVMKDLGGAADTPPSGYGALYVNSDVLYFKDDGGSTYNVHRGGKWQKTCGGYKTNNTSTSNYYYQYYVNYHSWSAYDSSPTTLGSSGTPAKDYVWKAPAAGTLTNIYVSARTYDTGYDDPFKFYVFKGTPADGDQNVSLTQIGVTGAIQASVTNRINIVSTDITSSNTFNAGECLWVMLKKDSSSGNLDAYFNVTIKGDFT